MKKIFLRGGESKARAIFNALSRFFQGSVLDVGCGEAYLRNMVRGVYLGVDFSGKGADLCMDIGQGINFPDRNFDTVVALDVLEHLERIHFIFDELCRVSKSFVIITLPNMYEWRFRLSFLFGKLRSGKYGLPKEYAEDRHRWLFSYKESQEFVRGRCLKNGFYIAEEIPCYFSYNKTVPKIINKAGALLGFRFCNLFCSHYLVVLRRK